MSHIYSYNSQLNFYNSISRLIEKNKLYFLFPFFRKEINIEIYFYIRVDYCAALTYH